jgi:hypothetical protein
MTARKQKPTYVVCVHKPGYPGSLERGKRYRRLPDARATRLGFVRVIDDSGESFLFPPAWFAPAASKAKPKPTKLKLKPTMPKTRVRRPRSN